MNLSTGRLIFAAIFLVAFVIVMFFAYKKDKKGQKDYFKGTWKLLVLILVILAIYFVATRILI